MAALRMFRCQDWNSGFASPILGLKPRRRGKYLYVQTGANGIVGEFRVHLGHLTEIGSVTVVNAAGGEGIVAA
jgi:hypothetical protein